MLILKMSMSLDGFVADANGDKAFIFSSMSEDAATAPKQSSSAGTASEPLAPSTTWSAGPDASYWRRTSSCCGPSSRSAGAPVAVRGFGMLFDDRQPDGNKIEER